jgi:uncharacterized protein (TIGR00369 family)
MARPVLTEVDPRMVRWVDEVLLSSPLARSLGIVRTVLEVDRVVLAMPFKPDNITLGAIVHGGAIATLIDIAGAASSASGANADEISGGATANLTIHYLAPADGCDLEAEALVVKRGQRQSVSEIRVRSPQALVATALITSAILLRRA